MCVVHYDRCDTKASLGTFIMRFVDRLYISVRRGALKCRDGGIIIPADADMCCLFPNCRVVSYSSICRSMRRAGFVWRRGAWVPLRVVITPMFRKLLTGCPCTPLSAWSKLATCNTCGEIFSVDKLMRHKDGALVRVPCARIAPDFQHPQDPRIRQAA